MRNASKSAIELFFEAMFANAEGEVFDKAPDGTPLAEPIVSGKPTEVALLTYGLSTGGTPKETLAKVRVRTLNGAAPRKPCGRTASCVASTRL